MAPTPVSFGEESGAEELLTQRRRFLLFAVCCLLSAVLCRLQIPTQALQANISIDTAG